MGVVTVERLAQRMNLQNLTFTLDLSTRTIEVPDVNRSALQLTGYWDYFEPKRVQIIGKVEYCYLQGMDHDAQVAIYRDLLGRGVPCLVYARSQRPDDEIIRIATENGVPLLISELSTSMITAEIIRWLHVQLAPTISIHGVLVDVFGEGVLITGESGIGKSEAALELIKRGHRLVADDVVEIRRVSDDTLVGSAPKITRYLIELRGIGIVDVKALFGVEAVKNTQNIDMVVQLEDWSKEAEYDRAGTEDHYIEYLGNKLVCYRLPVRPGRNLAIILESAAVNHRQKRMGYNAAKELYRRVGENLARKKGDDGDDIFY